MYKVRYKPEALLGCNFEQSYNRNSNSPLFLSPFLPFSCLFRAYPPLSTNYCNFFSNSVSYHARLGILKTPISGNSLWDSPGNGASGRSIARTHGRRGAQQGTGDGRLGLDVRGEWRQLKRREAVIVIYGVLLLIRTRTSMWTDFREKKAMKVLKCVAETDCRRKLSSWAAF